MTSRKRKLPGTRVKLVVAASQNHVIGNKGKLPWHIPEDLRHFKEQTKGMPMIMGRKTFDSLPKILPGRIHVVITRGKWKPDKEGAELNNNVLVFNDIDTAFMALQNFPTVAVIGGGEIYKLAIPYVDEIVLTRVDLCCEGDTFFEVPGSLFELVDYHRVRNVKKDDQSHQPNFAYCTYHRVR